MLRPWILNRVKKKSMVIKNVDGITVKTKNMT